MKLTVSIILIVTLLIAAFLTFTYKPQLTKVHENIEATYSNVAHIDAEILSKLNSEQIVIFDVREPVEFRVSHLSGAIQVDPDISSQEFINNHAHLLEGKTVIFYCSVGKRSSVLASQLQQVMIESNASNTFNLIGGIFQWRNDSRRLVDNKASETTKIHPYNKFWARYISNKRAISYAPSGKQ